MNLKEKIELIFVYLAIAMFAIFTLFPIYWVFRTSIMLPIDTTAFPPKFIPNPATIKNYLLIFGLYTYPETESFGYATVWVLLNSLLISAGTALFAALIGSPAAYALSRFHYGGKQKNLSLYTLSMRFFPPIIFVVPYYILWRFLGFMDTLHGLIIIFTAFGMPFFVWTFRQFLLDIPRDYEESAMVDGCSRLGAFLRVTLPLALPGLLVCSIFIFIFTWNDFLYAFILTTKNVRTVMVEVAMYETTRTTEYWAMSALAIVAMIPSLILAFSIQRYLTRGFSFGKVR